MRPLPGRTNLARPLQAHLGLVRAVETGTHVGRGARLLSQVFPSVVTIELSPTLAAQARLNLADLPTVTSLEGHSAELLPGLVDASTPTYWFLDGHWSGGDTAGEGDNCPVARELEIISEGHLDDVIVVDDARYFLSPPPPPYVADQWPTLLEIIDSVRRARPDAYVTVLGDQIVAVPARAREVVEAYGQQLNAQDDLTVRQAVGTARRELVAAARSALRRTTAARRLLRTAQRAAPGRAR
jgi:hypothetical protein